MGGWGAEAAEEAGEEKPIFSLKNLSLSPCPLVLLHQTVAQKVP